MSADILDAAKRELEALRSKLAKNPDFIKLQQVQRLIDTYESFSATEKTSVSAAPTQAVAQTAYRPGSKAQRVDEVIEAHFQKTGERSPSGKLMSVIDEAGIQLGGTPSRTLASFLTNSKRFNNVKGYGYGLIEWGDNPGPNDQSLSIFG